MSKQLQALAPNQQQNWANFPHIVEMQQRQQQYVTELNQNTEDLRLSVLTFYLNERRTLVSNLQSIFVPSEMKELDTLKT